MKICSRGRKELPLDMFHKDATKKDGHGTTCKDCRREYNRQWAAENPEKRKEQDKIYRERHPEKINKKSAKWAKENPEEVKKIQKKWRENNKEAEKIRKKKWVQENPELNAQQTERWRQRYPERVAEVNKRTYEKNKIKFFERNMRRKAMQLEAQVGTVNYKEILSRDNYICHICGGVIQPNDVHFDHVIPLARGGPHSMDNIKVAHSFCNLSKGSMMMDEYSEYIKRKAKQIVK